MSVVEKADAGNRLARQRRERRTTGDTAVNMRKAIRTRELF